MKTDLTPTLAANLSLDPVRRRRQLAWLERHGEKKSPQRRADAFHYLGQGFSDVFVVDRVTRLAPSPSSIPAGDRHEYTVEIRPAKSGKWSKPAVTRAVRDAAEIEDRLAGEPSAELVLLAEQHLRRDLPESLRSIDLDDPASVTVIEDWRATKSVAS